MSNCCSFSSLRLSLIFIWIRFFFFFKDSIGILCDSDVIYEKFEGDFLTFKLLQFINSSVIFGKLLSEILKETSKISIYSPNVNQLDNSLYKKKGIGGTKCFSRHNYIIFTTKSIKQ